MKFIRIIIKGILFVMVGLVVGLTSMYRSDIPADEIELKYSTSESRFIQVNDARMHVRIRGSGPAIFLIHGSFASLHTWKDWEDVLIKNYTTISMDLPGHGLTGPNGSKTYQQDYYRDLVFALADTLKIDRFYVAGNSMGGNVAYRMALQRPERIKKLILVDAAGGGGGKALKLDTPKNKKEENSRPIIFTILSNPALSQLLSHFTPHFLFKWNLEQVFGNKDLISEDLTDRYYDLMLREGNRQATIERISGYQQRMTEQVGTVKIPTLIIWGENDRWIPLANGYRFRDLIEGSELVVFPGVGHVPQEEIPGTSIQPVIQFLAKP